MKSLSTTVAALFGLFAVDAALGTPISASIDLSFTSKVIIPGTPPPPPTVNDNESQAWGTLLSPLSVAASAPAASSGIFVDVAGSASATWGPGGNSGSVVFDNYGWSTNLPSTGCYTCPSAVAITQSDWSYTFLADTSANFTMTYNVSLIDGDGFGLLGWNIGFAGFSDRAGLQFENSYDPTASGAFARFSVEPGVVYTITLKNSSDISGGFPSTHMRGEFDFSLTPCGPEGDPCRPAVAPEPSTVSLLGLVFTWLLLAQRRKLPRSCQRAAA